jgi:two-component system, NtrC family, nitrogen regulation sensor histidine kinase NtrY
VGAAPVAQGADHVRETRAAWLCAWAAVVLLSMWMLRPSIGWLAASAAAAAGWAALSRPVGRWRAPATLALAVTVLGGAVVQFRLWQVTHRWEAVRAAAEDRAGAALRDGLNEVFDRGAEAVEAAAESAGGVTRVGAGVFDRLESLRDGAGVTALAVYRPDGSPLAWAGEHRGIVPDSVRLGLRESSYSAGPLFGYLYFAQPLPSGRVAVAATLLEAHVEVGEGVQPYAERFEVRHGVRPRFTTPELAQGAATGDVIYDWSTDERTILSVIFGTPTQRAWRERVTEDGRRMVAVVWGVAALLLAFAWFRGRAGPAAVPVAALTLSLFTMPLGPLLGADGVFSPLRFVLPGPGDVTLGQLLVLLAGVAVWMLTRPVRSRAVAMLPLVVRTAAAAAVLVGTLALVRGAVAAGVLAARPAAGMTVVLALTLLAALPLLALVAGAGERPVRWRRERVVLAVALSVALALAVVGVWAPGRMPPVWTAALWALPFAVAAGAFRRDDLARGALLPWVAAGCIAGSLALAQLWTAHMDERLHEAERELSRLGTAADPFLDFLLREFSEQVLFLDAEGREDVSLLYQAWVDARLAQEGYEGRLTIWRGGQPETELRLADAAAPPELVERLLAQARASDEPVVERYTSLPGLHYLLVVPLPGGKTVSVAVPPRRYLGRSTALARFLDPGGLQIGADQPTTLGLVPAPPEGDGGGEPTRWVRTGDGWQSEATVLFPEGPMHAHLQVATPSPFILLTRGILALAGLLAVLTLFWAFARTLCGEPFGLEPRQWGWLFTFRGRLTLALFVFFAIPMAGFGAAAHQALSREVVRTASALADRALTQAAREVDGAPLAQVAARVDADLLRYQRGVLTRAAMPEVIDLGLYHAWLPPRVYLAFAVGEAVTEMEDRRLAGQAYVVAYRRLGEFDVLGAPTPLASGEIARRQGELTDVMLLAGLLGAVLSIVLSLAVGRAFSRPIEGLSRAAAAVGAGDLAVRLPSGRRDEFGGVYRSFNRMVRRLREARGALVREKRRTDAIVADAGTGVAALDASGRVALVNPRACDILGAGVAVGERLPVAQPLQAAVAAAVRAFLDSGEGERVEEREADGRIVRLRLRRLQTDEGPRGAVLVLEDVTNELRSARVLAWGEMARQVAHEIKNPLTPIKLAVQHVRRAYADGRPDFDVILDRNVGAILREIDHLGEISRAFARFGTPPAEAAPLERVDAGRVADETLALYRGGSDGIEYTLDVEPETPRACARSGELKEVLVNLLENARAAMDGRGEVRIRAAAAGGGAWVQVDVSDTGEGIPAESLPKVFEPQFSTRSSGTGLGLAIVKRLVESWGGEVSVGSEPGVGTTVHLRLRADGVEG